MKKTILFSLISLGLLACLLFGISRIKKTTSVVTIPETITGSVDSSTVGMANPASVNCLNKNGVLKIEKRPDGGEYGLCYFDDNRACEEWAMLRGDCPVGGRKTTGYDTIDQKFCAWSGGTTSATKNSICTFKNGSKCSTIDFYKGTCFPK